MLPPLIAGGADERTGAEGVEIVGTMIQDSHALEFFGERQIRTGGHVGIVGREAIGLIALFVRVEIQIDGLPVIRSFLLPDYLEIHILLYLCYSV